jgi:AAA domain
MSTEAMAYRPLTLRELYDADVPSVAHLVDGILPRGSLTLFTAREKAGKSLLSVDLVCSMAAAEPFLDRAVTPGPTLLVPAEDHLREVRDRIKQRLRGKDDPPVLVLPVNGFTADRIRLEDPASMQGLYDLIEREEIALAVLDPMRELHQQREDRSDDMGPLLAPLRQLAHQTDCAVVLIHHMNRQGEARGSTAIKAAVDQEWAFRRTADEDGEEVIQGTIRVEGRFGPPVVLHVRLGAELRWELRDQVPMPVDGGPSRGRILHLLRECGAWMDAEAIADALGIAKKTVQNTISVMLADRNPLIVAHGSGRKGDPRQYHAIDPLLLNLDQLPEMVPGSRAL